MNARILLPLGLAYSLLSLAISAAPQTNPLVPPNGTIQPSAQAAQEHDLPNAPSAVPRVPTLVQAEHSVLARSNQHTPCASVWIGSSDPWISPVQLTGRMLSIPEFVNSGITISPDAEHADLAIQPVAATDDDGTKLHFLIASSAKANVWDEIPFKWPEADYEEIIARKALRLVFAHCVVRGDNSEQESQLPPQTVKEKLSAARIMKPLVHTSFMRDKVLSLALANRPEFADWGIRIAGVNDRSDLDLVVGHVLSTLTWTFKLVDHDSGALLDQGTVIAFNDDRAAARIAASTVKQIGARRPLPHPTRPLPSKLLRTGAYSGANETWVVQAITEDMKKEFPGKVRLSIHGGSIMFADLQGRVLLSIPVNDLLDFADSKSYNTLGDNIRLTDDFFNSCDESCVPFLFLDMPLVVILDQFRIHQHEFEIAWTENETIRVASLQVSKGDYGSLVSIMDFLSQP